MIATLRPLMHEKALPFFEVNRSQDENESCGNNLLEGVVQTDYLPRGDDSEAGFEGDLPVAGCLVVCFAEPMFERVHRQFETIFEFKFAVN